jgi:hypothetical protein
LLLALPLALLLVLVKYGLCLWTLCRRRRRPLPGAP